MSLSSIFVFAVSILGWLGKKFERGDECFFFLEEPNFDEI